MLHVAVHHDGHEMVHLLCHTVSMPLFNGECDCVPFRAVTSRVAMDTCVFVVYLHKRFIGHLGTNISKFACPVIMDTVSYSRRLYQFQL